MKNVIIRCFLVVLLLFGAGCATRAQEEVTALLFARGIDMEMVESDFAGREIFTGEPCALLVQKGLLVTGINGETDESMKAYVLPDKQMRYFWSENKPIFLPPGENTFTILVGERANAPQVTLPFTFEAGKHYTLNFILHSETVAFTFAEITDKAKLAELAKGIAEKQERSVEKAASLAFYRSFSKENPTWLEGKWSVGNEKDELEFSGNTVKYVAAKSLFFDTRNTYEGVFIFDKSSMIIRWNSFKAPGNTVTRKDNPKFFANLPVYYTLNSDTLMVRHEGILPNMNGTYKRVR